MSSFSLTELHQEGDDEFWNQEFFAESEDDGSFEEDSDESQDFVDSDFFESEDSSEEDEEEIERNEVPIAFNPIQSEGRGGYSLQGSLR